MISAAAVMPVLMNAFSTIWEYPSQQCHNKTVHGEKYIIDFKKYNITTNTNFTFNGDKIVIFYETSFGLYPYFINYSMEHPVNGGIPQNCNLKAHLEKAKKDINRSIPDKNFSGYAIIDFEKWRPLFSENDWMQKRVFQNESIRKYSGTPNGTNISEAAYHRFYREAESDFNKHAKRFFLQTIKLGKRMRKNAKWGFYGFPYCNYDAGNGTYECQDKYKKWNDEMNFIFNASQALFPSVYLGNNIKTQKPKQRFFYVQAVIQEAKRISKKHKNLPILAYTKFEYDQLKSIGDFYKMHDLCAAIAQPVYLGIDGLILWSSSNNMNERCEGIKKKVDRIVGPMILDVTALFTNCSQKLCGGLAKCIRKDYKKHWCLKLEDTKWKFIYNESEYSCECNETITKDCIRIGSKPPKKNVSTDTKRPGLVVADEGSPLSSLLQIIPLGTAYEQFTESLINPFNIDDGVTSVMMRVNPRSVF
ncbi:unnamed protein product [Cylicocyclus nassatus]|uniref:Hyaluronidase n=1 Tax=Cylicocyclus nassatus TaxID=53992 RepID=A0AA36M122_CYLNA|nr:unnamed protein product [Cylicocyclus nassatus]